MREVRRRAERAGARRVLAWLGAISLAIGLGVPVGDAILSPSDNGAVIGVGISDASTTTSAPVDSTLPVPAPIGAAASSTIRRGNPSNVAGSALAEDAVTASRLDGDPAPTATTTLGEVAGAKNQPRKLEATDGYPLAPSCAVDNAGLGPRQQRTCQFTATTRGGAEMRGNGVATAAGNGAEGNVTVTRDGKRTTTAVQFNSASAGDFGVFGCGGLIEPGDLVEVVLTNGAGSPDGSTMTLGAGEGWYCWE